MKLQSSPGTGFDVPVSSYVANSRSNSGRFFAGKTSVSRRVSVTPRWSSRAVQCRVSDEGTERPKFSRRQAILAPSLALGAWILRSKMASADDATATATAEDSSTPPVVELAVEKEEVISSRIYDATAIGEPMAVGKDNTSKVWEKLMSARVVYLGEAEQVPIRDDRDLELEIVRNLKKRCAEIDRPVTLALEAFSCDFQNQIDQFMDKRIDVETLKTYVSYWPTERWQEYEPLLSYCRDNAVRIIACGTPLEVLRTVQAEGINGLSKADRKLYAPPMGSGFISGFNSVARQSMLDLNFPYQPVPFAPSSFLSAQARAVEDHTMSRTILEASVERGMMVVVTGASHVMYGSRGTGLPARISTKIPKKNQVVILLDPERQLMRREGEVPAADFLWYSAARPCNHNCFDRVEIARVMNAAGRTRDTLPQDLQQGLDSGLVPPEVLQNFFDLEQNPLLSELTNRFQGFRERLLADPKFLNRLAIEESISVTTNLLAQYERRKENFFEELDYVVTDTVRGIVVDFFTVWLPAPTLSFFSSANELNGSGGITGLLGSIPDNAFQKSPVGKDWNLNIRVLSVLFGGLKLASVGFISSIGAVASSNSLFAIRRFLNPEVIVNEQTKRSPILKTAFVYSAFLGISANLRYQFIAGIIEHRIADEFASQVFLVNTISFVARIINSYWGTQQWIDLARSTGLQTRKSDESTSLEVTDSTTPVALECNTIEDPNVDEIQNK